MINGPRDVDVLVIGAGPAGLAAAAAAAERGRGVAVIDQAPRAGGQIWRHRTEIAAVPAARLLIGRCVELGVQFVPGASVIDAPSSHEVLVESGGRIVRHRAPAIIVATGARERFLPFAGWTLPGVVGVGGLQALYKSGVDVRGARVVLAGTGPLLVAVAAALASAGAHVVMVAEQARRRDLLRFAGVALRSPARVRDAVRYRWAFRSAPYRADCWVAEAHGDERLRRVRLQSPDGARDIECDWLACSTGLVPVTEVAQLLGCAVGDDGVQVDGAQATSIPGVWAAGECTLVAGDEAAIAEGTIAGLMASGCSVDELPARTVRLRDRGRVFGALMASAFRPRAELLALATPDTVICRCEDVRRGAIDPAWNQRQAKLWTRVGMGACQGAVCGPACSALFGWEANSVRAPLGAPPCRAWGDMMIVGPATNDRS